MCTLHLQNEELSRTVGINTHYVDGLDFDLEKEDTEFLIKVSSLALPLKNMLSL